MVDISFHKKLLPIYLLTLVNILGFTLLIPVFPGIVEDYGGNAITYGFLISIYSLAQLISAPVLGTLSDKYGRRPMLILSQIGTLISWIIFGISFYLPQVDLFLVSLPMWFMLISRTIDGLTGGNVSIATAWLSDMTTDNQRLKAFSIIGIISSLGLIIGPTIGGILASTSYGHHGPIFFAVLLSLITLSSIYFGLKESLPEKMRRKRLDISWSQELNLFTKILKFRSNKRLAYLIDQRIFVSLIMSAFVTIIMLFIRQIFNWSSLQLGLLFLVLGVYFAFCQSLLLQKIHNKFGPQRTLQISYISLLVGLLLMIVVHNLYTFIIPMLLSVTGIALNLPLLKTLLTINVDKSQQGEITGIDEAINAGSSAIMPLIGGVIFSYSITWFWIFCALLTTFALIWSIVNKNNYQ